MVLGYSVRNLDHCAYTIYSVKITVFLIIKNFGNRKGILRICIVFLIAPKFIKHNKTLNSKILQNIETITAFSKKCRVCRKVESWLSSYSQLVAWREDKTCNRIKNKQEWSRFQPGNFQRVRAFRPTPIKRFYRWLYKYILSYWQFSIEKFTSVWIYTQRVL